MLIKVFHESTFTFAPPVRSLIQVLRMTPRNCEGQHVMSWRIDVDNDCRLSAAEDAFGNVTHTFSLEETLSELTLLVEGEVRTFDTAGVVRGSLERFPPELYLRTTSLTMPDDILRSFAQDNVEGRQDPLDRLHALMEAVHERMQTETGSGEDEEDSASAAAALATSRGSARDVAHLFIACARLLEIPARFVSGYMLPDSESVQDQAHAWAETHVRGLGWVAFDPVMKLCPSERHVRVACALDALGASPVRWARGAGTTESHVDRIRLVEAQAGLQHQS
jgi:transglutaminase-like putative cysteine protease